MYRPTVITQQPTTQYFAVFCPPVFLHNSLSVKQYSELRQNEQVSQRVFKRQTLMSRFAT